jgi:hypothetical protein
VQGQGIRLGGGTADVLATHSGNAYSTEINTTSGVHAAAVVIGHTLPGGQQPATVALDGLVIHNYQIVVTNRGTEVLVSTTAGHHTLTITTS